MAERDVGYDVDLDGLIARGLARYRAGDIDGALTAWEHALSLDPDEPRALGYVDYVRQNYDELIGGDAPLAEMLIPFGLGRGDDDEYEISISRGDDVEPEPAPEPAIDDGWGLEAEPNWLARAAMVPSAIELEAEEPVGDPSGEPSDDTERTREPPRPGTNPFEDEMTRDFLHDRRTTHLPFDLGGEVAGGDESGESTVERGLARGDFGPEFTGERTTEHAAARLAPEVLRGLGLAIPPGERASTSDEETRQHWPRALDLDLAPPGGVDPAAELGIESLEPPPPGERFDRFDEQGTADLKGRVQLDDERQPVVVEDLRLPPPPQATAHVDDDTGDTGGQRRDRPLPVEDALTAGLSAAVDDGAPPREPPDDRARRRITRLLERAVIASRAGEHPVAVAAIDLALSEGPDLASAQKLVHKSRAAILECYFRFFGDLGRRPVMVTSYDELTRRVLDPRAAFLLSRIDGTLSFEEILDVAGMGRLEACRHLAHLLWRGIIRVT
ncbi:MAG TPA: tetratricopeptide repeat protein [Kofleriaceae bacterium]|nr:tetratricopeptide repeat protein [Kofleriaceae bacterium]